MKGMRISGLLAVLVLAMAFFPKWASGEAGNSGSVKLDLYVMSQCPFGTKAEDAIFPAVKSLGKYVDFKLHFIANESTVPAGPDNKTLKTDFTSMHGPNEVAENMRHLCAMKQFPGQYMDFILERNKDIRNPDWQSAAKKTGVDSTAIEACSTGEEGAKLLSDSIKISQARNATGSPTIDLNGSPYTGARGERSVTLAVCDVLSAQGVALPEACEKAKNMPPDPAAAGNCGDNGNGAKPDAAPLKFAVKVLTDKTCDFCWPTLLGSISQKYPGAQVSLVDINSDEGKTFVERHHVTVVPFYWFDKRVSQDVDFDTMKSFYVKTDDGYSIQPGPDSYTPAIQLNRTSVPHHLDVFVESNSLFTAQVEGRLMKFLAETDIKDLTFSMHYIVQETAKAEETSSTPAVPSTTVRAASLKDELNSVGAGPLTSRRGEMELQESMRQVCLFQHAPIGTFFTYLTCKNQNVMDDSRGDTCLQLTEPVKKCVEGPEAESLLRQDARLVRELGITSGPVLLWENRYGPFGWHEVDWNIVLGQKKEK